MGADLVFYVLEMPIGKEPDWEATEKHIEEADLAAYSGIAEEKVEEHREMLRDYLDNLKDWWNGKFRRDVHKVNLLYTEAVLTGGLSWGDSPTDAHSELVALEEAGVLHKLGFFGKKKESPEDDAADLLKGAKRILETYADGYQVEELDSMIKALELKS